MFNKTAAELVSESYQSTAATVSCVLSSILCCYACVVSVQLRSHTHSCVMQVEQDGRIRSRHDNQQRLPASSDRLCKSGSVLGDLVRHNRDRYFVWSRDIALRGCSLWQLHSRSHCSTSYPERLYSRSHCSISYPERLHSRGYIRGHIVAQVNWSGYIRGHILAQGNRSGYISCHIVAQVKQSGYIRGHVVPQVNRSHESVANGILELAKAVYIDYILYRNLTNVSSRELGRLSMYRTRNTRHSRS
ncbi:hypothetical protein J6590_065035 [Homalodisca vitripennis]|nr:hypothetical protein J6590_065035 [Homalodisca vitripennis]